MNSGERPGDGQQQGDDPFAHLFRPDPFAEGDPADAPIQNGSEAADPLADWEPLIAVPTAAEMDPPLPPSPAPADRDAPADPGHVAGDEVIVDVVGPSAEEEPEPGPLPPVDPLVGRLFRSRGAPEIPEAVTAVGAMQARRLKTMARADEPLPPPEPIEAYVAEPVSASVRPISASGEPAAALSVMARPPAAPTTQARESHTEGRGERGQSNSGSLTGLGVYAVTTGVTVILAFGETLFFSDKPGIITGIGLVIVSVFAAFAVRTRDAINAIFAPPIAFFVAAMTAGQIGVNANGLSGRAVEVFFLLGDNWVWIIGATVASLVIVALRRRLA